MHPVAAAAMMLVVLLGLSGCLGIDENGGAPDTTSTTTTTVTTTTPPTVQRLDLLLDFSFEDCAAVEVQERPELAAVQALLPLGFTAREATDPVTGQPLGQGTVTTGFHRCAAYVSPSTRLNDTFLGRVAVEIEPPAGFPEIEAERHAYVLRMLSAEDVFQTVWQQAGYPVYAAPADVTTMAPAPGFPARQITATVGGYSAQGLTLELPGRGGSHAFYHRVEGGHLVWTGGLAAPFGQSGTGSFTAPGDDPAASARGGDTPVSIAGATDQAHVGEDLWLDRRAWP